MEALKLYQKAAQIAEVLAESMGGSITGTQHALSKGCVTRRSTGGRLNKHDAQGAVVNKSRIPRLDN